MVSSALTRESVAIDFPNLDDDTPPAVTCEEKPPNVKQEEPMRNDDDDNNKYAVDVSTKPVAVLMEETSTTSDLPIDEEPFVFACESLDDPLPWRDDTQQHQQKQQPCMSSSAQEVKTTVPFEVKYVVKQEEKVAHAMAYAATAACRRVLEKNWVPASVQEDYGRLGFAKYHGKFYPAIIVSPFDAPVTPALDFLREMRNDNTVRTVDAVLDWVLVCCTCDEKANAPSF